MKTIAKQNKPQKKIKDFLPVSLTELLVLPMANLFANLNTYIKNENYP